MMWEAPLLFTLCIALASANPEDEPEHIDIAVGRSAVLSLPRAPLSVSVTDPSVVVAVQLGDPQTWQLQGARIGTTDLVVTYAGAGAVELYDLSVQRDLEPLRRIIGGIAPGVRVQ